MILLFKWQVVITVWKITQKCFKNHSATDNCNQIGYVGSGEDMATLINALIQSFRLILSNIKVSQVVITFRKITQNCFCVFKNYSGVEVIIYIS